MELNDKFNIQKMDMAKKELSYKIKAKELEAYWGNECKEHAKNKHCKVYSD